MKHAQGPLLTIDVEAQTAETTNIDDIVSTYIGGRGLNTRLAYERIPFDANPFGPENRLFLATGPMQHSQTSFTGRTSATALSPLTEGLLSSNAGGFISRHITGAGYAAVEIVGNADGPLALHVRDDGVEFEEVPDLAEATVPEVSEYLSDSHDIGRDQIACIGPAGENLVRFASIMTSEQRAFGRGGLGAVLGAKGVKAVSFGGTAADQVSIDWPADVADIHREAATSDHVMKQQGTTAVTPLANEMDALPTRYFSETSFEGAEDIGGAIIEEKKYKRGTCSQCAFACKIPTRDEAAGIETEGPEYETVMSFGANAGVDDVVAVMKANELCDTLGMDTISCGDTVAAFLAAEEEFGNETLIESLIEQIAYRKGVGDTLAEGVDRMHEELGVANWSVKGMEFSAHDGRALHGQGLSFATSNRGADHMYGGMYALEYPLVDAADSLDPEGLDGKPPVLIEKENHSAILDSGIVCKFSRDFVDKSDLEAMLDTSYDHLQEVGARIVEMERAFNNARGFDRSDDDLPYDIDGLETALDDYYAARGWKDDGTVPGFEDRTIPAIGSGGEAIADD